MAVRVSGGGERVVAEFGQDVAGLPELFAPADERPTVHP
jgi:hypothetical protein